MEWDYKTHGVLPLGPSIPAERVAAVQRDLDEAFGSVEPGPFGHLCNNVHREVPAMAELLADGTMAALASTVLGTPVQFFQDNLVWKTPDRPVPVQWHQDYSYWPLDGADGVTIWLCFDDAGPDSGQLTYIPGTHLLGERQTADFAAGEGEIHSGLPPLEWQAHVAQAVSIPARAGDAIVHSPLVWHMSSVNRSGRHRRAWSLTFVRPGLRWDPDHAAHPLTWELGLRAGDPLEPNEFPIFGE